MTEADRTRLANAVAVHALALIHHIDHDDAGKAAAEAKRLAQLAEGTAARMWAEHERRAQA